MRLVFRSNSAECGNTNARLLHNCIAVGCSGLTSKMDSELSLIDGSFMTIVAVDCQDDFLPRVQTEFSKNVNKRTSYVLWKLITQFFEFVNSEISYDRNRLSKNCILRRIFLLFSLSLRGFFY